MLSFISECGISTAGNNARCALRMRVNMSEIGSLIKFTSWPSSHRESIRSSAASRNVRREQPNFRR